MFAEQVQTGSGGGEANQKVLTLFAALSPNISNGCGVGEYIDLTPYNKITITKKSGNLNATNFMILGSPDAEVIQTLSIGENVLTAKGDYYLRMWVTNSASSNNSCTYEILLSK